MSDDVWQLVCDCWQQQPLARPSMAEVRARRCCDGCAALWGLLRSQPLLGPGWGAATTSAVIQPHASKHPRPPLRLRPQVVWTLQHIMRQVLEQQEQQRANGLATRLSAQLSAWWWGTSGAEPAAQEAQPAPAPKPPVDPVYAAAMLLEAGADESGTEEPSLTMPAMVPLGAS
jgi:hypothetical protein